MGDGGPAGDAGFLDVYGVAVDKQGNFYFSDSYNHRVRKVTTEGTISTVAGGYNSGDTDNVPATSVYLSNLWGVAVDSSGNVFLASAGRIRKVSFSGIITTVAGDGGTANSVDGPAATLAALSPGGIALFGETVYVADEPTGRVRKVTPNGAITTVAGTGVVGYSGDGGPAIAAQLSSKLGLAADANGTLYIADTGNNRIRKVTPDGKIHTVAGGGPCCGSGDGGPASNAMLDVPLALALQPDGGLLIAESKAVRQVTQDGIISTIAGPPSPGEFPPLPAMVEIMPS